MAKSAVLVSNDQLILPSGSVPVESEAWFQWLEENKSFRFEADIRVNQRLEVSPGNFRLVPHIESVSFSATKEVRNAAHNPDHYWFATRKVNGKIRKAYMGKGGRLLTLEKLKTVALKLAGSIPDADFPVKALNDEFQVKQLCETERVENRVDASDSGELAKLRAEVEKWKSRAIALQKQLKQETERAEAANQWGHEQREETKKWKELAESGGTTADPEEVERLRNRVQNLESGCSTLDSRLHKTEKALKTALAERDEARDSYNELALRYDNLKLELAKARDEAATISQRRDDYAGSIAWLELERATLKGEIANLEYALKRSDQGRTQVLQQLEQIKADPTVTRRGKDKGAVVRTLEAVSGILKNQNRLS